MNGFLIASAAFFGLTLISFLTGSYNVDKYLQLSKFTMQQGALSRVVMHIGIYLFVLPAIFIFFAMKMLQISLALSADSAGNSSTSASFLQSQSLAHELLTQTGGVTLLCVCFGILLVVYAQVLINFDVKKKVLLYIGGLILFAAILIALTQTIVISLMIASIIALGVIILTYRRLQNQQNQKNRLRAL